MIIGVLKEQIGENRVALTPEIIKKLSKYEIYIEQGAGELSGYSDSAYQSAGGKIESNRKTILERSDILVSVSSLDLSLVRFMKAGSIVIGMLNPIKNIDSIKQIARIGLSSFSIDWLPRITRAQSMDVLSSQSNLIGYQSVLYAASRLGKAFPLMMTAAGSVPAAKVLIVGAGVAGLQAIATARRLGAIVSAFDVRSSAKEQVESLGASFIDVPVSESGDGKGGYAKEMSADYQEAQKMKLEEVISKQDVVITTAQIPNKPAPKIITQNMVRLMPPNSLIVDLVGETGGNCELSQLGQEIVYENTRICTPLRIVNEIANTASKLYASNIAAFITTLLNADNGENKFNKSDELIAHTLLTDNGVIVHPLLKAN